MSAVSFRCPRCASLLPAELVWRGGAVPCPACNTSLALQDANPTALTWYFAGSDQEKVGPFSWVQLRQLASQGMLPPGAMVWREGMPHWMAAGDLALFPPTTEARAASPAPQAPAGGVGRDTDVARAADSTRYPGRSSAGPSARSAATPARASGNRPAAVSTLGDFQIIKKLGSGGMGIVYLARQQSADRLIALKVLSRTLAAQPDYVRRFFREAEVLRRLRHPSIVEFVDVGEDKGLPYFAMEYIDGPTVGALLERRGGRFTIPDALFLTLAAARGLAYAHENQVIHRDIKPTNIMLNQRGHVKITDLGLARPLDEDMALTTSGASIGTPYYMAPEQARDAAQADPRSDVYGLGGVLYQMLTGALPFQGDSVVALLLAKEQGHFLPARRINRDIPDRLDLIIDKMLARDIRYRYASCAEVIRDLEGLGMAGAHLSFNPLHLKDEG